MARAARFTNRFDIVLFGGCILLSLVSMVLPPNLREPVAGSLRRSLVAPLVRLQRGAEKWRGQPDDTGDQHERGRVGTEAHSSIMIIAPA